MRSIELKNILFTVVCVFTILTVTAFSCDDNNDNSGSSEIQYNAIYNFDSVNLKYDFSSADNDLNDIYNDAGDLYVAHGTDPNKTHGTITDLQEILRNSNNYSEDRKPKIAVTINPASGGNIIEHNCQSEDIGSNYISKLPNLDSNISTMIVKVESITTYLNNIRLIWSKTFDFNNGWWDAVEDKALSGRAEITVGGYTKVVGNNRIYLVRITDEGLYQIVSYMEPEIMTNEVIECDVEIEEAEKNQFPGLSDRPIFKEDKPDGGINWNEPDMIIL